MQTLIDALDFKVPKNEHSKSIKMPKDEIFEMLLNAIDTQNLEQFEQSDIKFDENFVKNDDLLNTHELFETSNFMQILTILEVLNGGKIDKFPVLNDKINEFFSHQKNITQIKEAKNIFELIKVAKKFNLNLEKIEFTKELSANLEKKFPNLAKNQFFAPLKMSLNLVKFDEITKKNINKNLSLQKTPKILTNLLNKNILNDDFKGKIETKTQSIQAKKPINLSKNLEQNIKINVKNGEKQSEKIEIKIPLKPLKTEPKTQILAPKNEKNIITNQTEQISAKTQEISTQKSEILKPNAKINLNKIQTKPEISTKNTKLNEISSPKEMPKNIEISSFKNEINKKPVLNEKIHNEINQNAENTQITTEKKLPNLKAAVFENIAPKENLKTKNNEFITQKSEKNVENLLKQSEFFTQIPKKQVTNKINKDEILPQSPKNAKTDVLKSLLNENIGEKSDQSKQNLQNLDENSSQMEQKSDEFIKHNDFFAKNLVKNTQNPPKPMLLKQTFDHFASTLKEQVQNYKPPLMRVSLRLNPTNLGEIDVTLINRANNLHINFNSNAQTMNLFIQNHMEFKASLVNMGFSELQMNFSQQGNQKEQNQKRFKFEQKNDKNSENSDLEQNLLEIVIPRYI